MSKVAKIIFFIMGFCSIALILASCVSSSSLLYRETTKPKKLELINYNNPSARSNPSERAVFDVNSLEVLEEFDSDLLDSIDNFGKEFNLRVHSPMTRKQVLFSHDGVGLRLIYDDYSFQILTLTEINDEYYFFVGLYNEDGTQIQSKDVNGGSLYEAFRDIINKHFTIQI